MSVVYVYSDESGVLDNKRSIYIFFWYFISR